MTVLPVLFQFGKVCYRWYSLFFCLMPSVIILLTLSFPFLYKIILTPFSLAIGVVVLSNTW